MKALININTGKVSGLNRDKRPFEVSVLVSNFTKEIDGIEYDLINHPNFFTMDDLIEAKGKKILSSAMRKYIILNEELLEEDISSTLSNHSANTGFKFLQLHPNGQCRTNKINLPISTSNAGLYIEADEGITVEIGTNASTFFPIKNGEFINLNEETNSVYLRFKNETSEFKEIYSYGIIL